MTLQSALLDVGDRVWSTMTHDRLYIGTVIELTPPGPGDMFREGGVRVAWDDGSEGWCSYRSMVHRFPLDYGSADTSNFHPQGPTP